MVVATSSDDNSSSGPTTPYEHEYMPGNGTHEMGGVDGKNWGVYEATATGNCQWSIRSVARYRPGLILDEGAASPGQVVRVNIQPDGDVDSWSGQIDDDHRLVFMTNGCGAWHFAS
ncbi:hypothetical protein [Mycolicibacterium baixiangningiae]|uniref:hypothetical protein n=1 Tax=Mycolicibacterium baixiangningiae TaxID=2761578 RepID=UPI0027DA78E4|nr:hypothetical protein [Mycolicibacterium baixiangningiae]